MEVQAVVFPLQSTKIKYLPDLPFQVSHDKAFEWAEAVAGHGSLAGRGLSKVFFSMCGSTAVDTALKMALAYQRARGKGTKTRFIGRERS